MRRVMTTALVALAIGAAGCGGPKGEEFTTSDAAAIRQADAAFVAAFNAKDLDKLLSFYTENSVFMPPNAPMLRGKDPLKSFYTEMFAQGAPQLEMDPGDVAGHGPLAYQSGTFTRSAGTTRDRGKFLFVMRKMGDKWLFQHSIWSSDLPKPM